MDAILMHIDVNIGYTNI